MQAIDAYGEFEIPEEKATIEVVEDPVKTTIACYHLYQGEAKKLLDEKRLNLKDIFDTQPKLYGFAEKIFDGKEKLKIKGSDLIRIVKEERSKIYFYFVDNFINIDRGDHYYCDILTGPFLSAFHNNTALDVLVIKDIFCLLTAGYKLKRNKTLVIDSPATVLDLGILCQGNIINYADLRHKLFNNDSAFASSIENGLQINYGRAVFFGIDCKSGIQINNNTVDYFLRNANSADGNGERAIKIEKGKTIYDKTVDVIDLTNPKDYLFHTKIKNKLKEIEFLKDLNKKEIDEMEQRIREFDFARFEKELIKIVKEDRLYESKV